MRLLRIELYKLWHHRISKILIFGYFILIFSIAILSTLKVEWGPIKFHLADQGIFNFPYIWHFNTFMIALLKIFFAIIIVAMIGNEYSYKTLKQNLIDGLSKAEFLRLKSLCNPGFCVAFHLFGLCNFVAVGRTLFRLYRAFHSFF